MMAVRRQVVVLSFSCSVQSEGRLPPQAFRMCSLAQVQRAKATKSASKSPILREVKGLRFRA